MIKIAKVNKVLNQVMADYGANPFDIAAALDINVVYAPFEKIKGVCVDIGGIKTIVINENAKEYDRFILAHELYHCLVHSDTVAFYHSGINQKSKKEREANEFATKLLLSEFEIIEGMTKYELMQINHIPFEMEDYI